MILQRNLGFTVEKCLYLVMVLGMIVYSYMQFHSPRHPDPASGHVFPVISPGSSRTPRHTLYLTSSERSLFHASFIVMAAGFFGVIGHAMIRKRNRTTSSG